MELKYIEQGCFSFELTDDELAIITEEAKEREMSVEDYIESCISVGRNQ